jgi:hypothetical protein
MSIVHPQVRPLSALGQAEPSPWPKRLLVLAAAAGAGYLIWKSAEESAEPGFWVFMYSEDDDRRELGEGWEPKFERHFERRSDAEAYRQQHEPYFDVIEITEVTA